MIDGFSQKYSCLKPTRVNPSKPPKSGLPKAPKIQVLNETPKSGFYPKPQSPGFINTQKPIYPWGKINPGFDATLLGFEGFTLRFWILNS